MGNTCRRKNRSCRNRFSRTAWPRSRLLAATRRTLTFTVRLLPSRSKVPFSSTRSSLACNSSGSSPTSSRNSVPPSATSNRPLSRVNAPVYAPFSRPNSSLSISGPGNAAQLTRTSRPVLPLAGLMHGFGEQLFARARLARQQHRGIGGGHAPDLAQHGFHRRALRDDPVVADVGRELLAQVLVVELQPFFELRDLRVGVLQREIGPLAFEGVREDVRHDREPFLQHIRPLALSPQRTEAEGTHDGTAHDQRERQIGTYSVLLEERAITRRFWRKVIEARVPEGVAVEEPAKGIRQGLAGDELRNRLASFRRPSGAWSPDSCRRQTTGTACCDRRRGTRRAIEARP